MSAALTNDDIRTIVSGAWAEAVGETPSDDSNFFDVGRSLTGAVFCTLIAQRTGRQLDLADLYERAGFTEVVALVGSLPNENASAAVAEVSDETTSVSMLPSQQERWDEYASSPDAAPDVVAAELILTGFELDPAQVGALLEQTFARHGTFRTRYLRTPKGVTPTVGPTAHLSIATHESQSETEWEREVQTMIERPFVLEDGELVRIRMWQRGSEMRLATAIHHIACDDVSLQILIDDLRLAMQGTVPVDPAPTRAAPDQAALDQPRESWIELLAQSSEARLPEPPSTEPVAADAQEYISLDESAAIALRSTAQRLGVTSTAVFLAGISRVFDATADGGELLVHLACNLRTVASATAVGGYATVRPFPLPTCSELDEGDLVLRTADRISQFMNVRLSSLDKINAMYRERCARPLETNLVVATTSAPELPAGATLRPIAPPRCMAPVQVTLIEAPESEIRWEFRPHEFSLSEVKRMHQRLESALRGFASA